MGERIPLGLLVPLRLLCGLILVIEGWGKLRHGWLHGTQLSAMLDDWVDNHRTYAMFLPVVQAARSHPKIFAGLITSGELIIGLSMLLGVVTRATAFLGAVMLFSIAFGAGQGLAPPGNALLMGAIFVIFIAAPPGRVLGLDAALRGRLPRWLA
ncbi:MAG TPA: DoxX family membrane protein [Polyangia bacterium]|nr:DoxX family membrane protein [Polyangia bacterium]